MNAAKACPMCGRRAAELASGSVARLLDELLNAGNGHVAVMTANLSEAERTMVLNDYSSARRHIEFVFKIKLAHWTELPHVLCGVSHHSEAHAREAAARALALFEASGSEYPHHQLTLT
eukprot:15431304-Alexandrium_andersonii.AAC.1